MEKKQQQNDREKEILSRISDYTRRINRLQFEISSYQDLISDLYSDLSILRSKKEGSDGNTEKEEE